MGAKKLNFFDWFNTSKIENRTNKDLTEIWQALNKSSGVIEFDLSGRIIYANENFLNAVEYTLDEVVGQHHRIFCEPEYAKSLEYKLFWEKLNRGEYDAKEYKRKTKSNKTVWIQASYNPIFDNNGKPYKIIKFATDITEQKMKNFEYEGRVEAVNKAQAVIEFNLDGTIITANENFLKTFEYTLSEIKGRHHKMFCTEDLVRSSEYAQFWEKLNRGDFESREYKRLTKSGREVWIQASYNPIFDIDHKPYKVIKYATDISQLVNLKHMIIAMGTTAQDLDKAGQQLNTAALQMYENIKSTSKESHEAASMSDEVLSGVRTVATNTEEMVASIREISRSTTESSKMANDTLSLAFSANENISKLSKSSNEIGEVIKVINSIAQQTNLLALNATIEAARAGEAGKGFGVVANEVKELAKQTAKATNDISAKIGAIQSDSTVAVGAISDISNAIDKLNSIAGTIAAAVEEQTATTNEVSRVVNDSGRNIDQINLKISNLSETSNQSSKLASETLNSAELINKIALSLKNLVSKATF